MGLILALLALGVYLSFRIFRISDITVDGSITLGAAVSAVLLTEGLHPFLAGLASVHLWPGSWVPAPAALNPVAVLPLAFLAGALAGATTGVMHTKFKINPLLSGILVMTALYSVNLRVMGKSNLPLSGTTTLVTYAERLGKLLAGGAAQVSVLGWAVSASDFAMLLLSFAGTAIVGVVLYAFFRTDLGTAMRATGDNDQMIRALGVDVDLMVIAGLALSNGLVAVSGSLLAQYQGSADVQMGIGVIVWGLASVIIGEALVGGQHHVGLAITGAIMGSILYRLLVALVLRAGLNPNDLKLITAVFVFVALILPDVLKRLRSFLKRRRGEGPIPEKQAEA
jgi:putative tryptophan/tyrosine transport system permease protein